MSLRVATLELPDKFINRPLLLEDCPQSFEDSPQVAISAPIARGSPSEKIAARWWQSINVRLQIP